VLALALVRPWGRRVPRRLLGGVAWAASVVLTLYGGLLVAVGALVLAGVVRPAGPVDRTALRWHVLLWDVWFLGSAVGRGGLALRSPIPRSGSAMNQPATRVSRRTSGHPLSIPGFSAVARSSATASG
jgi:hypothetical protein